MAKTGWQFFLGEDVVAELDEYAKEWGMSRSAALTMIIKTVVGGKKVINSSEDNSDPVSSDLLSHAQFLGGVWGLPQIGGKPDCGVLVFLYFFSGAAGCSFKIFGSGFSIQRPGGPLNNGGYYDTPHWVLCAL